MIFYKKLLLLVLPFVLSGCIFSDYNGGGSLPPWLKEKVAKDGFTLKWNISGDYDITDEEIKRYSQINTGQLAIIIPSDMTFKNIFRYDKWIQQKRKEPFPYPLFIVSAQCDKQIVFAQVPDLNKFNIDLANGKFSNCKPVNIEIGLSQEIPPAFLQALQQQKEESDLKEKSLKDINNSNSEPKN